MASFPTTPISARPAKAASSSYDAGSDTYTVAGGGSDIWNNADQFNYLWQPFSGDGTIIAHVTGLQNTDRWAKAGVMFRDSSAAGAMEVSLVVSYNNGISFQWRASTADSSYNLAVGGLTTPAWIELTRSGDTFTAYYAITAGTPASSDWQLIGGPQVIPMSVNALVGLAVTSHDSSGPANTATFSGVEITGSGAAVQRPVVAVAAAATPSVVTGATGNLSVRGRRRRRKQPDLRLEHDRHSARGGHFLGQREQRRPKHDCHLHPTRRLQLPGDDHQLEGESTTSSVTVDVLSTLAVTPPTATVSEGNTQQFTAAGLDQFGADRRADDLVDTPGLWQHYRQWPLHGPQPTGHGRRAGRGRQLQHARHGDDSRHPGQSELRGAGAGSRQLHLQRDGRRLEFFRQQRPDQ